MAKRTIPAIDKDIDANRRELLRRHPIKHRVSAADWQAAWDLEPELRRRDEALFLERGTVQLEHDQRALDAMKVVRVHRPRGKKCPTCKRPGWREAA